MRIFRLVACVVAAGLGLAGAVSAGAPGDGTYYPDPGKGGALGQGDGVVTGPGVGTGAPLPVAPPVNQGRIFWAYGRRFIRATVQDTLGGLAREAYGDEHMWYLLYYQNLPVWRGGRAENGTVVLWLPPSPRERVRDQGGVKTLTVIPGDTFAAIASQLYGDAGMWPVPYHPNKQKLPNPQDPRRIFAEPPETHSKEFAVPVVSRGPGPVAGVPGSPGYPLPPGKGNPGYPTGPGGPGVTPPNPGGQGPAPGAIGQLAISSPSQIGPREAALILEAGGFYADRIYNYHRARGARNKYEAGLMALSWGTRYKRPGGPVALDDQMKKALFEEYQLMRQALTKYRGWDTISEKTRPREYAQWIDQASHALTEVPAGQRQALMRSLMQTESGRTHWTGYKPIVSYAGAVGFGQFLPATAKGLKINHYDPADNIRGIAVYLNQLIGQAKRKGLSGQAALRWALAAYNGGPNFGSSSIAYANGILGRVGSSMYA